MSTRKEKVKKYYLENRDKILKQMSIRNTNARLAVLTYYSGTIPFCACCGEKQLKFLSLDHINGGGTEHRRKLGAKNGKGANIYHWVIRNRFPLGFQVLCHNCNCAKGFYGSCPHKVV